MKIGILTHYFESFNYGGVLQAYALPKFLNNMGYKACQVNYNLRHDMRLLDEVIKEKGGVNDKNAIIETAVQKEDESYFLKRKAHFKKFREIIPHTSDAIYTKDTIKSINDDFDIIITGSDQVWNPNYFCEPFFLNFVRGSKKKIAYSASLGVNELTPYQRKVMMPMLEEIDHISVRENTAKNLIKEEVSKYIQVVVDPVLLLDKREWQEMAIKPKIKEKYIFTYFLGTFKDNRDIARLISDETTMPIVNIPHPMMFINYCDEEFSEMKVKDAGPMEFVGLVENSQVVVTDSFHGVLFAVIFEKDFFVLKRNNDNDPKSMNSRIVDLLGELGISERIISTMDDISKELIKKKIDYSVLNDILKSKINISKKFLTESIS